MYMQGQDAPCRAVSVMASFEDARLLALRSLKAAYMVAKPQAVPLAISTSPTDSVAATLQPLLDADGTPEASSSAALSCHDAILQCAVEVAQVSLPTDWRMYCQPCCSFCLWADLFCLQLALVHLQWSLQRNRKGRTPDYSAAAALCLQTLELTRWERTGP